VVLWTASDERLRQAIYDRAGDIISRTGWYPLPQGERLRSVETARRKTKLGDRRALPAFRGSLATIQPAVPAEGGCAVRVTTSDGDSLLLDSGLPGALETTPAIDLRFCLMPTPTMPAGLRQGESGLCQS
jgi:hypothetical protein